MKLFIGFLFAFIFFFIIFVSNIPLAKDLELKSDPDILAGEGETCDSPFRNATCAPGFLCYNVTVRPYTIGVCYPIEEASKPDFSPSDYRIDKLLREDAYYNE